MLRLLCVTAHPDDEASFGGTMVLARDRGAETHVICLTDGQAASHRGGAADGAALAAMRRKEFAASCDHLRITSSEVLHYPDAQLDKLDFYEVAGLLTRKIREIRPDVVLTFGPDGAMTAHPDHGMVALFTSAAFQTAPRTNSYANQLAAGLKPHQPQKLYYQTSEFTLSGRQPVALAPITTVVEIGSYLEAKIEAFKKHTSQAPLFDIFETNMRKRGKQELYHLAATNTPRTISLEHDIWEGVQDLS